MVSVMVSVTGIEMRTDDEGCLVVAVMARRSNYGPLGFPNPGDIPADIRAELVRWLQS